MRENRYTGTEITLMILALIPIVGLVLTVLTYQDGELEEATRYLVLALIGLGFGLLALSV